MRNHSRIFVLVVAVLGVAACGPNPGVTHWEKVESGTKDDISDMFGFGPNDIWAVGKSGLALHWDGTSWKTIGTNTSHDLSAVWGSSSNDVWIVGTSSLVYRWNGTTLTPMTGVANRSFVSLAGRSSTEVYLCASNYVYFYDGSTFNELTIGGESIPCYRFKGNATTGVFGLMGSTGGSSVTKLYAFKNGTGTLSATTEIYGNYEAQLIVTAGTDVWWWNGQKSATHWLNGQTLDVKFPPDEKHIAGWSNGPGDVWFSGYTGVISHWDGTVITEIASGGYEGPLMYALWGSTDDMWAAGTGGWILRRQTVKPTAQ